MNLALLRHFVRQDLIDKHAGSALGALWTLLLPLANILIFTLVFSRLMGARLEAMGMEYLGHYSYTVYLVVGLLAWNSFSVTLVRITTVFHDKAHLISKVRVSLFTLPLYILISEAVVYLIAMGFFCIFLLWIDFQWTVHWLWLPLLYGVQQFFAYALGLLCAIFSVFIRDVANLVGVITQLWFWLTPVVYVITILPERWAPLFLFNPLYHSILGFREALLQGQAPNLLSMALLLAGGMILLLAGLYLGRRLEKDIRDFL